MVGIVYSGSFHLYYIHGSRMYKTQIKRNSRTTFVVLKIQEGKTLKSFFFLKMTNYTLPPTY